MKITIELPAHLGTPELTESDFSQLLRDALGEFISQRAPIREYVKRRYPTQTDQFREKKIDEVATRVVWASMIKSGTVKVDHT